GALPGLGLPGQGMEDANFNPGGLQFAGDAVPVIHGAHAIEEHPHLDAALAGLLQGGDNSLSEQVQLEDIGSQGDAAAGLVDAAQHGLEVEVIVGKQLLVGPGAVRAAELASRSGRTFQHRALGFYHYSASSPSVCSPDEAKRESGTVPA